MAFEGAREAAARGVDVDPLVAREEHQLGRLVEVGAAIELLLAAHVERALAGVRVADRCEFLREALRVEGITACARGLAEIDLTAGREAVRTGTAEVHIGEGAVESRTWRERHEVERPGISAAACGRAAGRPSTGSRAAPPSSAAANGGGSAGGRLPRASGWRGTTSGSASSRDRRGSSTVGSSSKRRPASSISSPQARSTAS